MECAAWLAASHASAIHQYTKNALVRQQPGVALPKTRGIPYREVDGGGNNHRHVPVEEQVHAVVQRNVHHGAALGGKICSIVQQSAAESTAVAGANLLLCKSNDAFKDRRCDVQDPSAELLLL